MPMIPNGSRTSLPRFIFITGLPWGSRSSRRKRCALRIANCAASRTTSTSVTSASTTGLPASRQMRLATSSRRSLKSCWNLRSTAIRALTGVASQDGCACFARSTAAWTSLSLAHASSANTSPVAGFVVMIVLFPTTVACVAMVNIQRLPDKVRKRRRLGRRRCDRAPPGF